MKKLEKILYQEIKKVPEHLLRRLLAKKLKEQGLDNKDLLDKLTEHILSKSTKTFNWSDGKDDQHREISIQIDKSDTNQLEEDLQSFLDSGLPRLVRNSVRDGAKQLVKTLEMRWPEEDLHSKIENEGFRNRLAFRWATALNPLSMMLLASREIGQNYGGSLARSRAKKDQNKRQAIALLHMRACKTTMEIVVLLENGLPDGAFARWRTLYEISVVALLIDRFGDQIAKRYLAHDIVSMREMAINEMKHFDRKTDPNSVAGELGELERNYQAAVLEFGKSFASPNGWAAESLNIKNPRFQDLERAIDWKALPPNYKWSSHNVHAGVAGTVRTLGTVGQNEIIHAGATNAGLGIPIINTAYSLLQITSLVFGNKNSLETQIQMQSLVILRDKAKRECQKITSKLEEEELELHGM